MLNLKTIGKVTFNNFHYYWPPVMRNKKLKKEFFYYLTLEEAEIREEISYIKKNNLEDYKKFIMENLCTVYSYYFGYKDFPYEKLCGTKHLTGFLRFKILLEEEFHHRILSPFIVPVEASKNLDSFKSYFHKLIYENPILTHPFFTFVKHEIKKEDLKEFLFLEVFRNEVVDDEICMLLPGLQGAMKQVIASNLWDECGNGSIDQFHTTWLRKLVSSLGGENTILEYRKIKPWFSSLTSHSFNSLLTNKKYLLEAFGHFTMTESWVASSFTKILQGMDRLKISNKDTRLYFKMHVNIDIHHTNELIRSIEEQYPALSSLELHQILKGAHQALAAAHLMYDCLLLYFRDVFEAGKTATEA